MDRSLKLEHPVTIVYEDEQNSDDGLEQLDRKRSADPAKTKQQRRDNRIWSVKNKKLSQEDDIHNERTIEISILKSNKNSEHGHNSSFSSLSSSLTDNDNTLVQVSVIVDDDNDVKRRRHRDVCDDDDDDVTTSEEVFLGDVIETDVDGHVTTTKRGEMEVVEHETTRKCVILAPNTKLDSEEEEEGVDDVIVPLFDRSAAYEEAAALYRSSIRGQRSMLLPVVVFKTDAETQTSRSRTTQTGVDRSIQTDPRGRGPRTSRRLNLEEYQRLPMADKDHVSGGRQHETRQNRRTVLHQQELNNGEMKSK